MVSVIITTYGGSDKLQRAIQSILMQSYDDYEVIVVDDNNPQSEGRTHTEKLMAAFEQYANIHYLKHECNKNGAAARNTGIRSAKGKYICFLDDDDFMLKDRLNLAVEVMEKTPVLVGICYGVACIKDKRITAICSKNNNEILTCKKLLIDQNAIGSGSNIFIKKDIATKLHGFDESFQRFQDVEFMIRATKEGCIRYQSEVEIVKDISDVRMPEYHKVKDALGHFNRVFGQEIHELEKSERLTYFKDRYGYLRLLALLETDYSAIKETEKAMLELGICQKGDFKPIGIELAVWKAKAILKKFLSKYIDKRTCASKVETQLTEQKRGEIYSFVQ